MKQSDFEAKYQDFWYGLENNLSLSKHMESAAVPDDVTVNEKHKVSGNTDFGENFPEDYRLLCHHLSLARSRHYSPLLVERLEKLVINTHQIFYKRKTHFLSSFYIYFTSGFSRAVRKEWRWVTLSAVLFFTSFFGMLISLQYYPDIVYTVLSAEHLLEMESMYNPDGSNLLEHRGASGDFEMFGIYIFNNTGIGLRTFASGILFGIGCVITLIFNGLVIGGAAGHLTYIGYGSTFWPFVSGHSALEISAVILSGAAGFKLGFAIISPGRKSRLRALRDSANEAIYIMYGVATMFILAAFIEAYWSSITEISSLIKYTTGILFWLLLIRYFVYAGRPHAAR